MNLILFKNMLSLEDRFGTVVSLNTENEKLFNYNIQGRKKMCRMTKFWKPKDSFSRHLNKISYDS